jgi:NAD(P)-dependent dehydrogenase (short-subunit alcohol dehydrogenase family)
MAEYKDKVAIVTGGGAGIGKAVAHGLASQDAAVTILNRTGANARRTADELTAKGGRAIGIECDVADEAAVAEGVSRTVEAFGGVDILVNNAALHSVAYNKGFGELGLTEVRRLFDVNILGVIICSLACRAPMVARGGGVILNISSVGGYLNSTAYGVSKLAVRGITVSLAGEFSDDAIRVNGIAPGLIATEQVRGDVGERRIADHVANSQKIKRIGQVEDIVEAALYLCSSRSGFVTGETLKVSGGYPLFI